MDFSSLRTMLHRQYKECVYFLVDNHISLGYTTHQTMSAPPKNYKLNAYETEVIINDIENQLFWM